MVFPFWVWSLGRELMLEWSTVRCKLRARHSPYIFFGLHMFHMLFPLCTVRDAHGNGWNIKGDGREVASVSTNCA